MVAAAFTLGGTTGSPFSVSSGTIETSRYIPYNHQVPPLSGAFSATGSPGYAIGAGIIGTAKTISSLTASSPSVGYVTYTSTSHGFVVGHTVTISGFSPSGYNGSFIVTSVTTNTFTVENSTTGAASGTGSHAREILRSDSLRYRPIMFYSLAQTFTAVSASVSLRVATAAGSGGVTGPGQTVTSTVTWDRSNVATSTSALQYAVNSITTAGAAVTYYFGHVKNDSTTVTFRRGATSNATIAPNGIYENGVLDTGSWAGTSLNTTVSWVHLPNHPTGVTASTGTDPGEIEIAPFTAPSDNGGNTIYGYRFAYKEVGDTTWYVYGENTQGSPSGHTSSLPTNGSTLRGFKPGVQYDIVVAALNLICDRYNGVSIYPDDRYADYTATTAHTGENSQPVRVTAGSMPSITPKFGAAQDSFGNLALPTVKVRNTSNTFVDGTGWVYDGSKWTLPLQVAGGTTSEYTSGGITYRVHSFDVTSDTFIVSECPHAGISVDYLLVAGGGGGGGRYMGGGGGAGGMVSGTFTAARGVAYNITAGAGGNGGGSATRGKQGKHSFIASTLDATTVIDIAYGGGGGGAYNFANSGNASGLSGGSGGGESGYANGSPGSGTSGQGNAGGSGATYGAGGGGGKGAAGSNGTAGKGGAGGVGSTSSITGTSVYYAGGGGGGSYTTGSPGALGGNGGGGNGAPGPNTTSGGVPTDGTNGLGGGGGGANGYGSATGSDTGGDGGDGVVILRYIIAIAP